LDKGREGRFDVAVTPRFHHNHLPPKRTRRLKYAEDAVNGEPVSAGGFPATCDLQGDFQIMQGEPFLIPSDFLMFSIY
jgi:hypothetical protein